MNLNNQYENYILAICVFFLSYVIYLNRIFIAKYLNILDYPNSKYPQKIHKKPIPLIGGLIIFITVIILLIFEKINNQILNSYFTINIILYSSFFFLGLLDDRNPISPLIRTFVIIFSLLIFLPVNQSLIISYLEFLSFEKSVHLNSASVFFTIFCIFTFFNSLNFSDGINGSALSFCLLINFFLFFKTQNYYDLYLTVLLLMLLISNLKNKIFLGNSGTCFLSIYFSLKLIYNYNISEIIYCDEIFFLLFLPGADIVRVIFYILLKNKEIHKPDKNHLHHYLLKKFSNNISWIIYTLLITAPLFIFYLAKSIPATLIIILFFYTLLLKKLTNV